MKTYFKINQNGMLDASSIRHKTKHVPDKFSTSSNAEKILNIVSLITLYAGIILGIGMIALGFDNISFDVASGPIWVIAGFVSVIFAIVQWAWLKLYINISNNLFSIKQFTKKRFGTNDYIKIISEIQNK